MKKIDVQIIQNYLDSHKDGAMYLHLETTNGAYANHHHGKFTSGAFIRNAQVNYINAKITGEGPFRIGLELPIGWVYAEGITHYLIDEMDRLISAGLDHEGKLAVAFELSKEPFKK